MTEPALCHVASHLDTDDHIVHIAFAFEDDMIVVSDFRNLHQGPFDLNREDVDPLDDEHIVRPSRDPGDAAMGPSARARLGIYEGQVLGPIPQQRRAAPGEVCEHQFALLPVLHGFLGFPVDHLQDIRILPDMQALLPGTLERDPGAVHLRQAVGVIRLDSVYLLDSPSRGLGVRLRADERDPQRSVSRRIQPHLLEHRGQVERVTRDDVDHRGPEVLHQPDLSPTVARARRNRQRAQLFRAIVQAQSAGEQTIPHHVLEHIRTPNSCHIHAPGDQIRPIVNIASSMVDHRRIAGGA